MSNYNISLKFCIIAISKYLRKGRYVRMELLKGKEKDPSFGTG